MMVERLVDRRAATTIAAVRSRSSLAVRSSWWYRGSSEKLLGDAVRVLLGEERVCVCVCVHLCNGSVTSE